MANKSDNDKEIVPGVSKIIDTPISSEMEKSFMDYAMSVIVARALPDVRDGLKPVHRRIVFAAHEEGLHFSARYQKCAAIVGSVMKKYHPHGDMSIYDALVRMAQDFSLRYTLVDGQGNFGSIDGDAPAAMRYTEARLDKISDALLADIDKDTVKFIPNYSGDFEEPEVLPSAIPNLLLNGSQGIAVGMATNIPPHNLREVVDALVYCMENPSKETLTKVAPDYDLFGDFETEADTADLVKFIKGPDFPAGGHIYGKNDIATMYATGHGRVVMRATVEIVEGKKGFQIIATDIPYMVNKAELVAKIADLVKEKKIEGIADLRDESSRQGIRVAIDLKKDANPQLILNQLYKHTLLQTQFNANFVALVNGEPKTLNLKTMLEEFLKHRQVVIYRRTKFLLAQAKAREHILQGLKIALDHLDEVIKTIRNAPDADTAKGQLMSKFKLDDIQATAILDMQLRRLAALERQKIEDELKEITKRIADLISLLESRAKILSTVKSELLEIKAKYGDDRLTKYHASGVGEFEIADLVPEANVMVTLTTGGYIKRLPADSYKSQSRGGKGVSGSNLKEEDSIDILVICNTHDIVYFFTDRGKVYVKRAWDIPEGSRTARGTNAVNLLSISQSEKILSMLCLPSKSDEAKTVAKYFFLATEKGTVKKTEISEFANVRNGGITAIKLDQDDTLAWARSTTGADEVMLTSARGKSIRFSEKDVRPMGRATAGVRGIKLVSGDKVVGMVILSKPLVGANSQRDPLSGHDSPKSDSEPSLLTVSERGFGKQTPVSEYGLQNRGGGGIFTAKVTSKTGPLVAALLLSPGTVSDLILTSKKAQVIRLPIKDIPTTARATQGVTLMRFDEGDGIAAVTTLTDDTPNTKI